MAYQFYKEVLLTNGQEIINLEKPVIKELTELVLNGIEIYESDFEIIDPKTIKLNIDIYEDDLLKIKCQKVKVNYTVIGDRDAIIRRYDNSKQTLKKNSIYQATLMIGGNPFSFSFSSRFDKYFNNKKIIKEDCLILDEYLDDAKIDNRIYQNSKEIVFKTKSMDEYSDLTSPAYEIQQYVRYKTDVDLINSIYLRISSEYGSEGKKYGTTDISKEVKLPKIDLMLQDYKAKLKEYENIIFSTVSTGIVSSVSRFRKSVNSNDTTYNPFNDRNTF